MSDPHYGNVSLLLHCDGSNGSTTFTDTSQYAHAVTANGNAKISTAQAKFGASGYFSGADWLTAPIGGFGANDFTIEAWVYCPAGSVPAGYVTLWAHRSSMSAFGGPLLVSANANGDLQLYIANAAANGWAIVGHVTGLSLSMNVWQHLALVRSGTTLTLYKNGVAGTPATVGTNAIGITGQFSIMAGSAAGGQTVSGYIDDLRITQGIARYTAAFTPPTAPFPDTGPPAEARAVKLAVSVLSPALTPRTAAPTTGHLRWRGWAPAEARAARLTVSVLSSCALWSAPAIGVVPAPLRCVIPAGRLFFDQGAGERYLGETPGAELSIDLRTVEVYGSDAPVSELIDEVPFGVSRELAFKCVNPSDEVVSAFFGADRGLITQTAGAVTGESLAAVEPGRWYQLGRTASNPTGVRLVSAVTVTDDAEPTPTVFVAGRDYTVDPTLGRLYVAPGGTIADGTTLLVDYTRAAATRTRHQGANWLLPRLSGSLRFIAHNTSGTNRDIFVPRVVLRADGAVRLKRAYQDGQLLELGFKARFQRLDDRAALYIDGRAVA